MTASLTGNSFHSARCHYKLNVSSTWWMALSAKIYFDQVSALFCVTLWLSPFSLSSLLFLHSVSAKMTPLRTLLFCLSYSRQAQCLSVICRSRPWAMWLRVPVCARVWMREKKRKKRKEKKDIDPGYIQSVSQAEWLIGALQSDLKQGEHTQSYSSRSNSSAITEA